MAEEVQSLINAYIEGNCSREQSSALLQECQNDGQVLECLVEQLVIARLLPIALDEEGVFDAEVYARLKDNERSDINERVYEQLKQESQKTVQNVHWFIPSSIAACLVVCATMWTLFSPSETVAEVMANAAVEWKTAGLEEGDIIDTGMLELSNGYSQIRLKSGVELMLEAPLRMYIDNEKEVTLHHGKLMAVVPEDAKGFTVMTHNAEVIDIGTEFGVQVDQAGLTVVHVLKGAVKARSLAEDTYYDLGANEALSIRTGETPQKVASEPDTFLTSLPEVSSRVPQYLHWTFDESGEVAICRGTGIDGTFYDGRLRANKAGEGPQLIEGVYGQAYAFNGNGAHIETDFKGIDHTNPRTVAFWVKVPQDFDKKKAFGILGWGRMQADKAWQISPNPYTKSGGIGRLRVGTFSSAVVGSTDLRDDQWHHVAVVMYGGSQARLSSHVLMYIDGELEKTHSKSYNVINTEIDHEYSEPLGFAQNLSLRGDRRRSAEGSGYFQGAVDEVYIFESALSAEQVRSLMQNNSLR